MQQLEALRVLAQSEALGALLGDTTLPLALVCRALAPLCSKRVRCGRHPPSMFDFLSSVPQPEHIWIFYAPPYDSVGVHNVAVKRARSRG